MKTQKLRSAALATVRFIIRHRHDIADALMVVAAFLKFWPPTEYLPDAKQGLAQRTPRTQRRK